MAGRLTPGAHSDVPALDDAHAPIYTIGQASELLGLEVGALRRLDLMGSAEPTRSMGGQRRYSRFQLEHLARIQRLMAEGITAAGAARVVDLENQVSSLQAQLVVAQAGQRALKSSKPPKSRSRGFQR